MRKSEEQRGKQVVKSKNKNKKKKRKRKEKEKKKKEKKKKKKKKKRKKKEKKKEKEKPDARRNLPVASGSPPLQRTTPQHRCARDHAV